PHYTPPPRPAFLLSPTPTTWTCTLSLHDALPICERLARGIFPRFGKFECRHEIIQQTAQPLVLNDDFPPIRAERGTADIQSSQEDRKSTRLNSSHVKNSYAVFCLKNKSSASTWSC